MLRTPNFVVSIIKYFWSPGQRILEIGCGPAFLRDVFGKDYTGVDITDKPYDENLSRDVDIVCSAENLLVDNNSFDIVVIKSAFYMFNQEASLQEARRVLKDSGNILIFDYTRKTQKKLQKKEGHNSYPCWTQWGLNKLIQKSGFKNVKNFTAEDVQRKGLNRYYHLIRQEICGTWSIVCGVK